MKFGVKLNIVTYIFGGVHAVAQWLRHFGTNPKVTGSIPDGVIGIFY
jgi:ABC-type transport system involved in cytochrome c biogenesis permease subunit